MANGEIEPVVKLGSYFNHGGVRNDEVFIMRHRYLLYNLLNKKIEWVAMIGQTKKCLIIKNLNTGEKNYIIKEEMYSTYSFVEQIDNIIQ
jgi:hypothetical protein